MFELRHYGYFNCSQIKLNKLLSKGPIIQNGVQCSLLYTIGMLCMLLYVYTAFPIGNFRPIKKLNSFLRPVSTYSINVQSHLNHSFLRITLTRTLLGTNI